MNPKLVVDMFMSNEIKVIQNNEKMRMSIVEFEGNYCVLKKYIGRNLKNVYQNIIELQKKKTCEYITYIYAVEYYENDTYIIEEYLAGETLAERIKNSGTIPENDFVNIVGKVCDALEYLHKNEPQIIHRDIKPKNIMLLKNGIVKLFDFDAARVSKGDVDKDTVLMGTMEYIAPEQRGCCESGPYSDIYSLGVTMCEMLSGEMPRFTQRGLCLPDCGKYNELIKNCLSLDYMVRLNDASVLKQKINKIFKDIYKENDGLNTEKQAHKDLVQVINAVAKNNEKEQNKDISLKVNTKEHIKDTSSKAKTKEYDGKKAAQETLCVLPEEIRDNFLTDHGTICKGEKEIILYYANQNMQDYDANISERKRLVKKYGELIGGNRSYLFDTYFNTDKIRRKLRISTTEQIFLYVDTSLFGNMKSGLVITDEGLYWTELLEGRHHIPFKRINSHVHINRAENDYIIVMQHGSMVSSQITASELNKEPLCELLSRLKVLSGFLK